MKKIISILILMIILLSVFQSVVLGVTKLEYANLKKGSSIETGVQFYENGVWFTIEANYIYYQGDEKAYPAYCISHRKRWSRRSWKLSSRY